MTTTFQLACWTTRQICYFTFWPSYFCMEMLSQQMLDNTIQTYACRIALPKGSQSHHCSVTTNLELLTILVPNQWWCEYGYFNSRLHPWWMSLCKHHKAQVGRTLGQTYKCQLFWQSKINFANIGEVLASHCILLVKGDEGGGEVWECKNVYCCHTCKMKCGHHCMYPFWMLNWVDVMKFISWNSRLIYKKPINMKTYRQLRSKVNRASIIPTLVDVLSLSLSLNTLNKVFWNKNYRGNLNLWYERSKFMQIICFSLKWKVMSGCELNLLESQTPSHRGFYRINYLKLERWNRMFWNSWSH